ncbi:hypothetical protein BFS14_02025 [Serratia fonticola]|uniref:hypothetical protein n=1 Tax=Serratia fonticola TaxID=47917 RepID=UPI0008FD20E7|nr:hypothetical protein [Serratia fonticola]OIX96265.1 hypothetical protein BFS14_02025 [Serratia fonticola]QCR60813.1 hypothetical protein FD644_10745 [Serratia fonticola]
MNVLTYEQLKQRLDAVVAECARVQAFAAETARDAEEMATADGGGGGYIEALNELLTPATSAALAEVEAKAVERFIAKKLKQLEAMHPDTHAFGATAMEIRSQINELQAYVVELREGRVCK